MKLGNNNIWQLQLHKITLWSTLVLAIVLLALASRLHAETEVDKDKGKAAKFNAEAATDYKILFAPPDGSKAADTWLVDIGPSEAEASADPLKKAKREYAKKHIKGGKIEGPHKPRDILWNKKSTERSSNAAKPEGTKEVEPAKEISIKNIPIDIDK